LICYFGNEAFAAALFILEHQTWRKAMLLFHQQTNSLVEVLTLSELFNPGIAEITGCDQCGQEAQDPDTYLKSEMTFPSGEPLPQCWLDPHYRLHQQPTAMRNRELINI
jgi:hypothetical protein